ncbi:MAG: hypothetical protein K2W96_02250 [Gemmataceae bacterium]|nr:hypothetical protein [Gemmataceae bacterium]
MTRQVLILVPLLAASLGFAPLPFPRPPKKTPARAAVEELMGKWHNPAQPSVVVDITPTEYAFINSGVRNNVYKLTLDTSAAPFKFDIRKAGANFVGIWKIEGDKLSVRYASERVGAVDGGRPTAFNDGGTVETYFRMGAAKKP